MSCFRASLLYGFKEEGVVVEKMQTKAFCYVTVGI